MSSRTFDFEKVSFEDFLSDTSYGDVTFERHVQYNSDKVPQYLVTNWEFSDELSGLWSASAYYVSMTSAIMTGQFGAKITTIDITMI